MQKIFKLVLTVVFLLVFFFAGVWIQKVVRAVDCLNLDPKTAWEPRLGVSIWVLPYLGLSLLPLRASQFPTCGVLNTGLPDCAGGVHKGEVR